MLVSGDPEGCVHAKKKKKKEKKRSK